MKACPPRGICTGGGGRTGGGAGRPSLEEGVRRVLELREQGLSMKDAARQAAAETGLGEK